jgi:hypothetical protein
MLSERAALCAQDLHTWRRDGVITRLGLEHQHDGAGLPLDHAVAIVLNDIDDLDDQAASGAVIDDSYWRQLNDDIEHLHRLITDKLPA